ncbi:hypothetical protein F4678DRAFT_459964 [Xylaria arbuscula]|nr:hypothetical protein F4678DRAFT_459964 [Xylaria arbuscula]
MLGGGTAGLAVAARLFENPSQRVLILEAGHDAHDDHRIKTPYSWLKVWADTFRATGHYMTKDPFVGSSVGSFTALGSVDPATGERSHSAAVYYHPIKTRENLYVITNAMVEKVLLRHNRLDQVTAKATGVLYRYRDEIKEVTSEKEVILAAGSLQSPKLLELSGISHADLLRKHGIDPIIDLPGGRENLFDHIMCSISFAVVDELDTLDAIF